MINYKSIILALIVLTAAPFGSRAVQAQTINLNKPSPNNVIKAGTAVRLRLLEEVSSKTARVGERIRLELMEDVKINNKIIKIIRIKLSFFILL